MKLTKIFSFILACVMLGTLFAFPAYATDEIPKIVVSVSESPTLGEEFQVTVALQNNPGVWAVAFSLDMGLFEFVSADTSASVFDQFGVCGYDESVNAYKFNGYYSDPLSNLEEDGTLAVLTLKVKETAEIGDYELACAVDVANTINVVGEPVALQTAPVTVAVKAPEVPVSSIVAADVALGTDITVNFYADVHSAHEGAQMRITMGSKEAVVDGVATEEDGVYAYPFRGVAPQCMGDLIRAELIFEDAVVACMENYSVRTYCDNMLAKTAEELGMSAEKYAALRTAIADLLEYGASAQIYRGYKTNALVNEGITGSTEFVELTETDKYKEESASDDVKMTSVSMYFDYCNSLVLRFNAPELTDENCYVLTFNDVTGEEREYALSECELVDEETSAYMLVLDPVFATGYNDLYFIELYGPNARNRVVLMQSLEYSFKSYVYSMQNKVDVNGDLTPMAKLARATYNYGLSATAYSEIDQ